MKITVPYYTAIYITQSCGLGHHFTGDPNPVPYPIFYFEDGSPDPDPNLSAEFMIVKFLSVLDNLKSMNLQKTKHIFCRTVE